MDQASTDHIPRKVLVADNERVIADTLSRITGSRPLPSMTGKRQWTLLVPGSRTLC